MISRDERRQAMVNLIEPVEVFLKACPAGIGEAMLVHLVRVEDDMQLGQVAPAYAVEPDDQWVRKVRLACKRLGASRDEQGVWRLAA